MIAGRGGACSVPPVLLLAFLSACAGGPKPVITPSASPGAAILRLQQDIDALIRAPALQRSTWGILVRSLLADEVLYTHNPQKLLLPASNVKVITLAAAAERLGWTFSFDTQLAAAGPVDGGVLYGDLVVVGSGDPSIDDWDGSATRLFAAWAEQLKADGITVITGGVIGDDNRLSDRSLGAGWAWDDLDRSFATAAGALQFNQNTARLTVAPGAVAGDPGIVGVEPFGSGLTLRNLVLTTAQGVPAAIETRRGPDGPMLEVRGSIPVGSAAFVRNVSAFNPTLYFVIALRDVLIAAGIEIRGAAVDVDDLGDRAALDRLSVLVTHRSPPLSALAVTMMKMSQNLFAESVLQAMGGPAGVRSVLSDWDVIDGSVIVADGSGLSRYNLATADALVGILTRVYRDERQRDLFQATLPVAGRDGTLAARMNGTAADGNVRAKTGAFSNARSLSGYVRTADGEPLVFSILANNFGASADLVENTTDAIVIELAKFSRR
jgi:D-alanyl-D-alanine carboxypeptidase/D-alanyl-D-alanine-endopeptidase (penicillin-binding protein 4)